MTYPVKKTRRNLPDEFHLWQAELLSQTFRPPQFPAEQIFVASDLNLYYDPLNTGWYKRPDWFAVVGVLYQGQDLRLSYVSWQEGVRPVVVIELLHPVPKMRSREKRAPGKATWKVEGLRADFGSALLHYIQSL